MVNQSLRQPISLSKVLGSDRGPGLDARTETAVLGSLKTVVLANTLKNLLNDPY